VWAELSDVESEGWEMIARVGNKEFVGNKIISKFCNGWVATYTALHQGLTWSDMAGEFALIDN
jgi:hypothetical protein